VRDRPETRGPCAHHDPPCSPDLGVLLGVRRDTEATAAATYDGDGDAEHKDHGVVVKGRDAAGLRGTRLAVAAVVVVPARTQLQR